MRLFAHGIELSEGESVPTGLKLIGTTELPIYSSTLLTLVDHSESSLNERLVAVGQGIGSRAVIDYLEEADLHYGTLACAYHLQQLALAYRTVVQLFEEQYPGASAVSGNTSSPPVFYETDAFLLAARRWYELLLRVLWKHYGDSRRQQPNNVIEELEAALPPAYVTVLRASWSGHAAELRELRNCVAHSDPVNTGSVSCFVKPLDGRWALTVQLPANPRARSRTGYDFEHGRDALEYCHWILCHLADLADATCALPAVRNHLDHPPGYDGLPESERVLRARAERAGSTGS